MASLLCWAQFCTSSFCVILYFHWDLIFVSVLSRLVDPFFSFSMPSLHSLTFYLRPRGGHSNFWPRGVNIKKVDIDDLVKDRQAGESKVRFIDIALYLEWKNLCDRFSWYFIIKELCNFMNLRSSFNIYVILFQMRGRRIQYRTF